MFYIFRRMGMWAFSPNYFTSIKVGTTKLFMESYFDLAMCSCLNTLILYRSKSWEEVLEYVTGRDNIMNFCISAVVVLWIFYFPILSYKIIHDNF